MKKYTLIALIAFLFIAFACNDEEPTTTSLEDELGEITTADEVNDFIWKGLNLYYLWQADVPDLADNRFNNLNELFTFFRESNSPESTFSSLLFQEGTTDRFSWIVDDYITLENSFQGINLTTGMEIGLRRYADNPTNVYAYVRYVIPNSSAATAGLQRGMLINRVNDTQLTDTNFRNLLFGANNSLTIGLGDFNEGNPIDNSTTFDLTKTELQENPIAVAKVIESGNSKVGYLLYNQFASSFDQQLNTAFGMFKAESVKDLIVDLRYNPGGSTRSATRLGSMITGQFPNQVYAKQVWNEKVRNAIDEDQFVDNFPTRIVSNNVDEAINSLNLPRVYFIVSGSSASASELVINALDAYIDVQVVGTKTVGKQVGSITLYDSDNLFRSGDNLNPDHRYAMQPLVFEIQNKDGINYINGIIPGNAAGANFSGINLAENPGNLGVLGETSDPLLQRTLTLITTGAKGNFKSENINITEEIYDSKLATPAGNNMYTELKN
ncbi:S41 family peptidase [uncultured Polaribacter sp.]|uniref:S41 family peptidase n=1 Tax=uncultured Polaribacter sp. TaxID=174711 RepID=UPI002608D376|nr:S41 family peptidase [uncultured Polaribacter sp.]